MDYDALEEILCDRPKCASHIEKGIVANDDSLTLALSIRKEVEERVTACKSCQKVDCFDCPHY